MIRHRSYAPPHRRQHRACGQGCGARPAAPAGLGYGRAGLQPCYLTQALKVVFHTLRHTFASWLVQTGMPLYTVQRLMGHKSIIMTQLYAHLAPDQDAEAARLLSSMALA